MTVASFVIVPASGGVTVISTVALASSASVPRSQVTVPVDSVQVPWLGLAEPKATPAGRVSVTCTPVAACGPALCTVSV